MKLRKKILAFVSAGILFAALLISHQVNAASPITSPNMIDGSYAHGSTSFYDSTNPKYAGAVTIHIFNTYKEAKVVGYYISSGMVYVYVISARFHYSK